ncbi:glutathione S-transferase 2 isoform X4 [Beta vulgaris subsp. vulgaris]|uniref:glutathione S-transferase 2 isoform X4 n=1 Tax=Beta vulgaris subsp. vulgaris TaxID=3555 RepID=UPI0009006F44|nr:glutathione S-transferase 2 isoform X4 [Beta vulgaris subsp. vulgaris]
MKTAAASSTSSTSSRVLYSFWLSFCAWRVRFALNMKGLQYEYKSVDLFKGEQFHPEFEQINPLRYVPVLVDDGVVVSDSLAILMYLEDRYPENPLLPADPCRRALNLQAASIVSCSMQSLHMRSVLEFIENKLGQEERTTWVQMIIDKGFSALEKLLKDYAGRYSTGDEVSMCPFLNFRQMYFWHHKFLLQ